MNKMQKPGNHAGKESMEAPENRAGSESMEGPENFAGSESMPARGSDKPMQDLEIRLDNKPGSLALMGETLGRNKISLEGGGVFECDGQAVAHFLVEEGERARAVLWEAGIAVAEVSDVVLVRLRQDVPGQLGLFCRRLADAKVNIRTQYSDHANQLVIVPDDYAAANRVAEAWMREW